MHRFQDAGQNIEFVIPHLNVFGASLEGGQSKFRQDVCQITRAYCIDTFL